MADRTETIDASPVKRFFIEILVRDIGLIAAILDLVDNSVDSARTLRPDGNLKGIAISVVATPTEFSIEDNCAGIGVEKAQNDVFRIGRETSAGVNPGSIGQFGVGLKRALFKLGRSFIVQSTTRTDSFTTELDVAAWMERDEWTFPMTVHDPEPVPKLGTTILVDALHERVVTEFAEGSTLADLADELRSRHRLALGNGLELTLNGEAIQPSASTVALSDEIRPAIRTFSLRTDGGPLSVRIVAGVSSRLAEHVSEDADPETQTHVAPDAGWQVFGNDRLLLANDTTKVTGWGTGRNNIPQYHNQFARFRGFVYLDADDPNAIPWNTMKTGVDSDSVIWREVRDAMIDAGREIINLLNYAKAERTLSLSTKDAPTPIIDALRAAGPREAIDAVQDISVSFSISMDELREGYSVKATFPAPAPMLTAATKKIQYQVAASAFQEIVTIMGTRNAAEIGRQSFDEYYANHAAQ